MPPAIVPAAPTPTGTDPRSSSGAWRLVRQHWQITVACLGLRVAVKLELRGCQLSERPAGRSEVAVTGNILSSLAVFELNTRMI
jgi:hypothetical protein